MMPDSGNWVKIRPSTPSPGVSTVETKLRSNLVYCSGWCSALGFVGPYSSQLHDAMTSCAPVSRMRLGIEVGQLLELTSPKPSIVLVWTVTSPVACSAAVIPYDASCMTE